MKKLYVVDVSSFFFRAFYAIPHLTSPSGMPTNALYGFLSMTIKLLREIKPDYMAFCFDRKDGSFRFDIYEDYKANRGEMPEDLVPQVPYVEKLTNLLGIPHFDKKGYEADDVIGSLTKYGRDNELEVVIVSGDKDFAQLVAPCVSMYDTMKNKTYDEAGVIEKWGVKPDQMIDYLALVGDSSDNIPGVRGIGPKGAEKLLKEFKTLEGIYENLDKIPGKAMRAKLEANKDMAYLSKELVTIVTDVKVVDQLEQLKLGEIQRETLRQLLDELGFKSLQRTLLGNGENGSSKATDNISQAKNIGRNKTAISTTAQGVVNAAALQEKKVSLQKLDKMIKPYSEIWGLNYERGFFLGYSDDVIFVDAELNEIGHVLQDKQLLWKGFNLKEVWKGLGVTDPRPAWDSMLAGYVVRAGAIEFEDLLKTHLGKSVPDLPTASQVYSLHRELEIILKEKLKEVGGLDVFGKFELPLAPVLYTMEKVGIKVNPEVLRQQSKTLEEDLEKIETTIHEMAGEHFNISSPKQLAKILFEKMGLTPGKKTKTGYSTNSDVLEKLRDEHPIADCIIEYRELSKLKSTYVDALPQLIQKATGRIHTNFRQAATTTGRLSSINPNLQNIPIRTDRGRLIRRAFEADPGCMLISVDYSQIELRVLAHISKDPGLISAFEERLDIHTATASEIFGVSLQDVTPDLRRTAKAVNFGIAYGQGAFGLSEALGIPRGEASEIIDRYFSRFRGVRDYMESIVETAKKQGYVETLFGRRRYIDELKSKNGAIRKFGERAAINAPIQGTASDLVKLAMIRLHDELTIPMLLQVHDELLFESPANEVDEQVELIKPIMESVTELKVPLVVNVAYGKNWEDAHA